MAKIVKATTEEQEAMTADELKQDAAWIVQVRARTNAYPSMEEQADMQYWDEINGTTIWKDTITKIKADYSLDEDGLFVSPQLFPDAVDNKGPGRIS